MMKFNSFVIAYCALLTAAVAFADSRGWILTALSRGGLGRSYRSYSHK